jgi:hypothetical protein
MNMTFIEFIEALVRVAEHVVSTSDALNDKLEALCVQLVQSNLSAKAFEKYSKELQTMKDQGTLANDIDTGLLRL